MSTALSSHSTNDFIAIMQERGFIHQCSDLDALKAKLNETMLSAYIGFDCTAPSLHVGSLVQIMMLRWLQKCGHRPIVLLGGGTTRIGDPSGRDESRQLLDSDGIARNMAGIRQVFEHYLHFDDKAAEGGNAAILVNNDDWLSKLNYIEFLRDIGPHFTINRMLTFDSVKLRLEREQPLTFLEFNYMILQAYDFRELHRRYGCLLQMGGSDQWGNIINGIELTRRLDGMHGLFGLTTPLITTADGKKMGKSASGAVWLNEAALGNYDYWQFWRNCQDADIGRFLKLFTELPMSEIARLEALEGSEINAAKEILADEATKLCRGREAAEKAKATARETFAGGAGADLPSLTLSNSRLREGIGVLALFTEAGLSKSNGEARRLFQQGGLKVNDKPLDSENQILTMSDLQNGQIKLSAGKKRHMLIKLA